MMQKRSSFLLEKVVQFHFVKDLLGRILKGLLSVTVQGSPEILGGWQSMCLFIQLQQGLRVFNQSQFRIGSGGNSDCNQHAKEVQR